MDWYIAHIVSGYVKRDITEDSDVYVQEAIYSVQALNFDEARAKAKDIVSEQSEPSQICIVDPKTKNIFVADCVGVELRQIMEVSFLSDQIGDGQIKHGSELTYFPMIFSSKEDFLGYASGGDGHKKIEVKLFQDPADYHLGA